MPGTYIPFAGMNVRRSEEKEAQACAAREGTGNNSPFGGVMKLSLQGPFWAAVLDSLSINDECKEKEAFVRKKGVFSNGVNLRKPLCRKALSLKC